MKPCAQSFWPRCDDELEPAQRMIEPLKVLRAGAPGEPRVSHREESVCASEWEQCGGERCFPAC